MERFGSELLQLLVGLDVLLVRGSHEFFQGLDAALFSLDDGLILRRFFLRLGVVDKAQAELNLIVDVLGNEAYLLDHLLFVIKLRKRVLEPAIELFKSSQALVLLRAGTRGPPRGVNLVDLLVEGADGFDELAQHLYVAVARIDFLVQDNPVEAFFGWFCNQFLGQGNVFLG